MRYFCTYFDGRYLPQGLALYESLNRHCSEFRLWVLCLDTGTYASLSALKLPEIQLITLDELECDDALLQEAKTNRSLLEYYFTCTPSLPLFILRNNPAVDLITYLDADLFFFSAVDPLFDEIGSHSIAIIEHRFPPAFLKALRHGVFNVGWVTFRRDDHGIACLQWWRERCIRWCSDKIDGSQFADQKYLDDWPTRFQNVIVLQHKGANLAPWNLANYEMSVRAGDVYVDDEIVIFFHFHGLKRLNGYLYSTHLQHYGATASAIVVRQIYAPYVRKITSLAKKLKRENDTSKLAPLPRESAADRDRALSFSTLKHVLRRHHLVVINGRIL